MEEILRTAFTLGQQWVQDMNNDKEPMNFNDWYNSNEVQQQLKILNIPVVSNNEVAVCRYCNSKNILKGGWCDDCGRKNRKLAN